MRRMAWALLFCVAGLLASASAQGGIYGKLNLNRFNNQNNNTSTWFYGPGFGVYYDFMHAGPISLGGDLRGDFLWGDQQKYRSILVGARLAVKPPVLPIKPYVQASVGTGGTKASSSTLSTSYSNKFQYQILGGVDVTMLPRIDLRLLEVGYGHMSGVGGGPSAPASTMVNISTGIVIRLP